MCVGWGGWGGGACGHWWAQGGLPCGRGGGYVARWSEWWLWWPTACASPRGVTGGVSVCRNVLDILRNNSRLEGLYAMATSRAFQVRLLLLRAAAGSCGQLRAAAGSCGQQRRRPTSNQSCVLHLLLPTVAPDPACPCLPRVERRHHCSSA